jgi:outer membrane protein assembly factor BamB
MLLLGAACATHFSDVPPDAGIEVRTYLGTPTRAPAADVVLDTTPELVWTSREIRGTVGVPAVGERVVVVATVDRWIYALDARTGEPFWRHRAPGTMSTGPLIAGGTVLAATQGREGEIIALDLRTGKRRWEAEVGDVASPLVAQGRTVYGATQTGTAFAFAIDNGARLWMVGGIPTRSGPMIAGDHLVIATLRDSLVVLRPSTGRLVSRTPLHGTTIAPLALMDDSTVVLTSPAGEVLAVSVPSGAVRWRVAAPSPIFGAPVSARDTVFALCNEGTLLAIPARDPGGLVQTPIGGLSVATPVILRHGVLVAMVDGDVIYFDRVTGRRIWMRRAGGELRHPPIVAHGHIVVAPLLGDVTSFR